LSLLPKSSTPSDPCVHSKKVISLYGSKILAYTRGEGKIEIDLAKESDTGGVYIHTSTPGVTNREGPQIERKCDVTLIYFSETELFPGDEDRPLMRVSFA
jgi:hypothetical protein